MTGLKDRGDGIRKLSKELVLDFMKTRPECQAGAGGMKQAEIFRECGFDWGKYPKATSSNQQYWIVALLHELAEEGRVERVSESGPWRLISMSTPVENPLT